MGKAFMLLEVTKGGRAPEWVAHRGGGVTDPVGVQGALGCCVERHVLMRTIGDG